MEISKILHEKHFKFDMILSIFMLTTTAWENDLA